MNSTEPTPRRLFDDGPGFHVRTATEELLEPKLGNIPNLTEPKLCNLNNLESQQGVFSL